MAAPKDPYMLLSWANMKLRDLYPTMEELAALLETAGGEAVGWSLQNRDTPDPGSFIGSGKAKEIKELIAANDCDLAVFDNELSPRRCAI